MSLTLEEEVLDQSQLGKISEYHPYYDPSKLYGISRQRTREELGLAGKPLPFYGFDLWNHYEISWLNAKGKPVVAVAEILYPCHSPRIMESKHAKLYFHSFNNSKFEDVSVVEAMVAADLTQIIGMAVSVKITLVQQWQPQSLERGFQGGSLDVLDVVCDVYTVTPELLTTEAQFAEETLHSDLLKSSCLVTHQPDWGSVQIKYKGKKISHTGLLKYIVSFRNHHEFNEQCIERIFLDIQRRCQPDELAVYGRYTRRGGLDINVYRSSQDVEHLIKNARLCRQ